MRFGVPIAASCPPIMALAVAITCSIGCTTFDGLSASNTTKVPSDASVRDTTGDVVSDTTGDVADAVSEDSGSGYPPGYLSMADAVKVCSLVFRCDMLVQSITASMSLQLDALNFSICLDWLTGPIPGNRIGYSLQKKTLECIAQAADCTEAGACLSYELMPGDDPRCAATDGGAVPPQRCADDGSTVVRCEFNDVLHCDSSFYGPGSTCMPGEQGAYWCALEANCTVPTSCVGSLLEYCSVSQLRGSYDCAYSGHACGPNSAWPDAGYDIDCTQSGAVEECYYLMSECRENVVAVCGGGIISIYDCAQMGATCSNLDGTARCMLPNEQCSPSQSGMNQCNGNTISLCVAGNPVQFDCSSVGLTCQPGVSSKSPYCG